MQLIEHLFEQTRESHPLIQFFGVMIVAMIPFLEGYFAVPLGIAIGLPVVLTISAAVVGNWLSVMAVVLASDRLKRWFQGRRTNEHERKNNKRIQRGQQLFHKYGVPGVSLLGPLLIGDHLGALICIASGASKRYVIIWQTISILAWSIGTGVLVLLGINIIRH